MAQDANILRQLVPMLSSLRANRPTAGIDEQVGIALFDAGYWSERNATAKGTGRLIATTKSWELRNKARSEG